MTGPNRTLMILPCLDSPEMAAQRQRELRLPRERAAALGRSAVEAIGQGFYLNATGARVDWRAAVEAARAAKRSLSPEDPLPQHDRAPFSETRLQVTNETTLAAARGSPRGPGPLGTKFRQRGASGGRLPARRTRPGGGALSLKCALCDPRRRSHVRRARPASATQLL